MKKIVFYVLALIMLSSLVFAAEGPPEETGAPLLTGSENVSGSTGQGSGEAPMLTTATQNQGEEQQLAVQTKEQAGSGAGSENSEQVRTRVEEKLQERERELEEELVGKPEKEQKVLRNQNPVRLAVHALLEMKDEIGGIGKNVSAIAREFNNSVQSTIETEKKIQNRSSLSRFFAGGDKKLGEELTEEVKLNKQMIEELKLLKEECDCGAEAKTLLEEHIQAMDVEQTRLQEMADKEIKSKGLFGWLWK